MSIQKKGLGKGLNALMSYNNVESNSNRVYEIDINKISPNKEQPRTNFNEESLQELANSIKEIGIIQPLTVKKIGEFYEIVAGERRWRAGRLAGLKKIPVIIREFDELKTLEAALIENIQRVDLNPIEEALTYKRFYDEFKLNQEEIAKKVGKSRSAVANAMRLINLDLRVQNFIKEGKISNGHGRALLSISDNDIQFELAERIIEEELNVRQIEEMVKEYLNEMPEGEKQEDGVVEVNENIKKECEKISNELKSIFGTKVKIKTNKKGEKGKIEIEYVSLEDLDRIVGMIKSKMI